MDQKESSEEKISRVISEAVELIISWIRGKNNRQEMKIRIVQ